MGKVLQNSQNLGYDVAQNSQNLSGTANTRVTTPGIQKDVPVVVVSAGIVCANFK